jgi:hypothetical protein
MFDTVAELEAAWASTPGDAAFMPYSPNFPVVDFVLRINGQPLLLNSTVSKTHDIKVRSKRFRAVVEAVGLMKDTTAEIPFLWVLPTDHFERFNKPGLIKAGTSASEEEIALRLAQYKLQIEIPPTDLPPAAAATVDIDEGTDGDDAGDSGSDGHSDE